MAGELLYAMAVRSRWSCAASIPGTLSILPDAPHLQLSGQPPEKQLNERVTRGKVELSLTVQTVDAADTVVAVNQELAKSYRQACGTCLRRWRSRTM